MKRAARTALIAVSALAVLGALLWLLVLPVRVAFNTPAGESTVLCGTAFNAHPISLACPGAQSTRKAWGFGLLVLGVAGVVGGVVVPRGRARRAA